MNHLAHFLLCPADNHLRAGTLIADFVRGNDLSALPAATELGVRLHRRIDATVDQSALLEGLKPLVGADLRRYAGILFDVFFDYALIQTWHEWHAQPLAQFSDEVYRSLAQMEESMPAEVRAVSTRMREFDALSSCATPLGCSRTLDRISRRLRRPVDLAAGMDVLTTHEASIVRCFRQVFPELQATANDYIAGSSLSKRPLELSVSR